MLTYLCYVVMAAPTIMRCFYKGGIYVAIDAVVVMRVALIVSLHARYIYIECRRMCVLW